MKLLTDIEQSKVDFYKLHPEAIIKTEQPKTIAICNNCLGHITINHKCLKPVMRYKSIRSMADYDWVIAKYSCPHCREIVIDEENGWLIPSPIPHTIVRMVKHWTKLPVKTWFRKNEGEYFHEYEILQTIDNSKY